MSETGVVARELLRIVREVWSVAPGLPIDPLPATVIHDPIRAEVAAQGEWRGQIGLEIERSLAERGARKMFELPDHGEINDELVLDFVRELVNMFGGNLKAALPGRCSLSVPRMVDQPWALPANSESTLHVALSSDGEALLVTCIHEAERELRSAEALLEELRSLQIK